MTLTSKLKLILLSILLVCVAFMLHQCSKPIVTIPKKSQEILKPDEKIKVEYNERTHTLTQIKDNGTVTKQYARNPIVIGKKNGEVSVHFSDWGFEHEPFVGFGMHDSPRVHLGISFFYYNKFDLNVSLALTTAHTYGINDVVRGAITVSYNMYSNTSIFVGIDSHKTPCGGLMLRW